MGAFRFLRAAVALGSFLVASASPTIQPAANPTPNGGLIVTRSTDVGDMAGCKNHPGSMLYGQTVGSVMSGALYCTSKWQNGVFPNRIEIQANTLPFVDSGITYMKITYSDETFTEIGERDWAPFEKTASIDWNPMAHWIDDFTIWGGGGGGSIRRIRITTSKICNNSPCQIDIGSAPDSEGTKINTGAHGMLLGFYGKYEADETGRIYSIEPYFSKTAPFRSTLTEINYNPSFDQLNQMPIGQQGLSVVYSQHILENQQASSDATIKATVALKTQTQTKITRTSESGKEEGGELGGTIGIEASGKAGVPFVLQGEVKTKFEITGKWVHKDLTKTINSDEDMEMKEVTTTHEISSTVKPGKRVVCDIGFIQGQATMIFTGKLTIIFKDQSTLSYKTQGTFQTADASQAISKCRDLAPGETIPGARDTLDRRAVITQSGSYCPDGTRVGDVGMTGAQLTAKCKGH